MHVHVHVCVLYSHTHQLHFCLLNQVYLIVILDGGILLVGRAQPASGNVVDLAEHTRDTHTHSLTHSHTLSLKNPLATLHHFHQLMAA